MVDAIASGSAVLVTDGSYSCKIWSDIDGTSWMIYCRTRCKVVFKGSFYEWCGNAGSYRGEFFGILAVHVIVLAVERFYNLPSGPPGLVACDNLGGRVRDVKRFHRVLSMLIFCNVSVVSTRLSKAHCSMNMFMVTRTSTKHGSR
jgi:elongation factor P hydroxylase